MGLNNLIGSLFGSKKENEVRNNMTGCYASNMLPAKIFYKEFVIQSCVSIIANALVMAEFQTMEKGVEKRKNNHYLLNVQPNKNQNATEFWNEAISRLIYDNECLIVMIEDELFVAQSFTAKQYAYYEDVYSDVVIRDLALKRTFLEHEVLYLKLNDKNVKKLIDGLFNDYSQLLTASMKSYKKANGFKAILKIDSMMPTDEESQKELQELLDVEFKNYIEKDEAIMPLSDGMDLKESDIKSTSKDTRDIKKLIDDIIEFVCMAMRVPVGLVKGDVAGISEQTDNFLMLCINPFAKLITSEINRKMYSKAEYLAKTYVKMDTQKIRLVDLEKVAKAADLLFRIGVHNRDDNRELVGKERLNTKDSTAYYVTKNYSSVVESGPPLKGGEKDGEHGKTNGDDGDS